MKLTPKYFQIANILTLRFEISQTQHFPLQTQSCITVQVQESIYLMMDFFQPKWLQSYESHSFGFVFCFNLSFLLSPDPAWVREAF